MGLQGFLRKLIDESNATAFDALNFRLTAIEEALKETQDLVRRLTAANEPAESFVAHDASAAQAVQLRGLSWPALRQQLEREDLRSMKNQFNSEADQVAAYLKAKSGTAQQE